MLKVRILSLKGLPHHKDAKIKVFLSFPEYSRKLLNI